MIDDLELARTLLEQGVANRDQLRQARQLQLTQETTLYLAMIEHDIIEEAAIVEIAASLLNVPCVTLGDRKVDPAVATLIPVDMARLHGVLPLELREDAQGELLLLAMRDPLDIMAMDDISAHVNVGIQPVLCGPRDLMQAIERVQAPPILLSMARDNSVDFGEFSTSAQHEQDSLSTEDSWAVFFDDALSQPEPSSGLEMRDRASTMALDLMDIDEILDEATPHQDPLSLLDEPGEPSSAELSGLNGWEVDSSLSPPKPPPPLPGTPPTQDARQMETSFDELYAAIDDDMQGNDPAPSGTFIAGPSMSLTGEHDAEEIKQSIEDARRAEREALRASDMFAESEIIGEAPSIVSVASEAISEPVMSDEAGSQTQMGSLGLMLADSSDALQESRGVTHDRAHLSLNEEKGSFTTLGTPKRLNSDGTERPMLVIKSDGEDLFSQALADIDALDEQASEEETPQESPDAPVAAASIEDPAAALGRLKLKRVAVPRHGLLDMPIIERSRIVEQQDAMIVEEASLTSAHATPLSRAEGARDILEDDDILAGFQAALDDDDEHDALPSQQDASRARGPKGLEATREFDASDLFGIEADGEDGLDEATNAAIGEAQARIERLNSMIRNANSHASGEHLEELGAQGTDGEIDAPAAGMRVVQATRSNQALTRDSLAKMRQSTMDLSSDLLFSGTNSPGLPRDVDDSRLLRAALMILISQDLIKIDELIALAKSLPAQT